MNDTPNSPAPMDIARLRELYSRTLDDWEPPIGMDKSDADFFTAIHKDAPALLDEVERLREISAHEDRLRQFSSRIAGMLDLDAEEVDLSDAIQTLSELLADRDKLREEVRLRSDNQALGDRAHESVKKMFIRRSREAQATCDKLRQQNERLLKEIEELKSTSRSRNWKENR